MPDLPQPGPGASPSAPGAAPAPGGGGITDAIAQAGDLLTKIAQAVGGSEQLPDEVKQPFQAALEAFRSGAEALVQAAGGGGGPEPDGDEAGPTTMEQGGSKGAVPMSHQNMRG